MTPETRAPLPPFRDLREEAGEEEDGEESGAGGLGTRVDRRRLPWREVEVERLGEHRGEREEGKEEGVKEEVEAVRRRRRRKRRTIIGKGGAERTK